MIVVGGGGVVNVKRGTALLGHHAHQIQFNQFWGDDRQSQKSTKRKTKNGGNEKRENKIRQIRINRYK